MNPPHNLMSNGHRRSKHQLKFIDENTNCNFSFHAKMRDALYKQQAQAKVERVLRWPLGRVHHGGATPDYPKNQTKHVYH